MVAIQSVYCTRHTESRKGYSPALLMVLSHFLDEFIVLVGAFNALPATWRHVDESGVATMQGYRDDRLHRTLPSTSPKVVIWRITVERVWLRQDETANMRNLGVMIADLGLSVALFPCRTSGGNIRGKAWPWLAQPHLFQAPDSLTLSNDEGTLQCTE